MRRLPLLMLGACLLGGCMNRTERLFQRAELFLSQGQPELAANEYYRLATKYPRSSFAPNALYKLAYLHREEFNNPQAAIQTYQTLVERYPGAPFADESWLWILQIQGESLKDTAAMRRTRDTIQQRYTGDARVCALAQLQFARSLLQAGHTGAAEAEARILLRAYPRQERQCAAAMLILARLLQQRGGKQSDEAVHTYEQIVSKYPNTASAVEAKRAIGWLYYGKRGEQLKAEQVAKTRAARLIGNVPAPPAVSSQRLRPFACLSSLLAAEGVSASPEDLLVVSGAAFDFWFEADRADAPRLRLTRNCLPEAAEAYGFSANVSTMPSADSSFAGLAAAIGAGHPAMVPLSDGGNWWVVAGYKPAEDRVYVLDARARSTRALSRSDFLGRWARGTAGHTRCVTGPYFYLSLGARGQSQPPAAVVTATARHALEARAGISAGYQALSEHLSARAAGTDADQLRRLHTWADQRLPEVLAERMAIANWLKQAVSASPGKREALTSAAASYEEVVRAGQQLRQTVVDLTRPSGGAEPPADATWADAADLARRMQSSEERALQQLDGVAQ